MASTTVLKCKTCNIVINEVLAFVQNKSDVMDEVALASLCLSSFTEEDVVMAKNLLYDSVSRRKTKRQGDGKKKRNLDDIITLIKEMDPEELPIFVARELQKLPPVTFDHIDVTRLLKDIIVIQKEIRTIQENIYKTEVEYVSTTEFQQLKLEIENLKRMTKNSNHDSESYVNTKRGAFCMQDSFSLNCDSGPMGLITGFDVNSSTDTQGEPTQKAPSLSRAGVALPNDVSLSLSPKLRKSYVEATRLSHDALDATATLQGRNMPASTAPPTKTKVNNNTNLSGANEAFANPVGSLHQSNKPSSSPTDLRAVAISPQTCNQNITTNQNVKTYENKVRPRWREVSVSGHSAKPVEQKTEGFTCNDSIKEQTQSSKSVAEMLKEGVWSSEAKKDDWTLVQHKKRRLTSRIGSAKIDPQCKFRAATYKIPLYLSNVSKETTMEDIADYILDQTGEKVVLKKLSMKREQNYDSYKLSVSRNKLHMFLDDSFWPEEIFFRRFYNLNKTRPATSKPSTDGVINVTSGEQNE